MAELTFRTTKDFEAISRHIYMFNGISIELSSKRLHKIKESYGLGGADNVIFDFCGSIYLHSGERIGSLTYGGKRGTV